jgi:N-acyl-D-aspartate/D-glutamate deacylase
MSDILITNARIFDGSGSQPFTGEVLVQGNRIRQVRRGGAGGGATGRCRSSTPPGRS